MEIPLDVCLCGQQKKLLKSYQSSGWQMLDLNVPHASDCTVESRTALLFVDASERCAADGDSSYLSFGARSVHAACQAYCKVHVRSHGLISLSGLWCGTVSFFIFCGLQAQPSLCTIIISCTIHEQVTRQVVSNAWIAYLS